MLGKQDNLLSLEASATEDRSMEEAGGEEYGLRVTWAQIPALPLISCVTMSKLFCFSVLHSCRL